MQFLRQFRRLFLIFLGLSLVALVLTAFQFFLPPQSPFASHANMTIRGEAPATINTTQAAACLHSGLAPDIAKQEFGWDASFLQKKYLKTTLCDDTLLSMATVLCLQAKQLFSRIGWPPDLLNEPYNSQPVCTKAHPAATVPPTSPTQPSLSSSCVLNGLVPYSPVDVCSLVGRLAQIIGDQWTQGVQAVANQTEALIDGIPVQATYQNPSVIAMWSTMVGAADILVGVLILWTGLKYLLSGTSAVEYASVIETLPRLLLTLLVVHFSMTLAQFVIDLTNALCATVGHSLIPPALIGSNQNLSFFVGFLAMFHSLLSLFLILQAALELAGIVVAIPLGPLCLLCLFHPDTQRIARTWISAFSALCLMRFLQVLALTLGEQMLTAGVMNTMPSAETLNLVLGIGVLGIAAMVPSFLRQWILVPISGGASSVISTYFIIRSIL